MPIRQFTPEEISQMKLISVVDIRGGFVQDHQDAWVRENYDIDPSFCGRCGRPHFIVCKIRIGADHVYVGSGCSKEMLHGFPKALERLERLMEKFTKVEQRTALAGELNLYRATARTKNLMYQTLTPDLTLSIRGKKYEVPAGFRQLFAPLVKLSAGYFTAYVSPREVMADLRAEGLPYSKMMKGLRKEHEKLMKYCR